MGGKMCNCTMYNLNSSDAIYSAGITQEGTKNLNRHDNKKLNNYALRYSLTFSKTLPDSKPSVCSVQGCSKTNGFSKKKNV